MPTTRIALCSIVLNEEEFLEQSFQQHIVWPGLCLWVFVHGACRTYANANPGMVTEEGFSVDRTAELLTELAKRDPRIRIVDHGWADHTDQAQEKVTLRNQYLTLLEEEQPDTFVALDTDEFYSHCSQGRANELVVSEERTSAFLFRHRDLVSRPRGFAGSIDRPCKWWELQGGYWAVPHLKVFRWITDRRYAATHNHPDGYQARKFLGANDPECIHFGFARNRQLREATNRFYVHRGEGMTDGRQWYVDCRQAIQDWEPGQQLPYGAKAIPFTGTIPEAMVSWVPSGW